MRISVVMPVRNSERWLAASLESVAAQSLAPVEVVLVDDASTDATREIAAGFDGVRVIPLVGGTLGDAFNEGIAATSGTHIAFQASDDLWLPRKLEGQSALLARTGAAACIGLTEFFVDPEDGAPPGFRHELLEAPRPARLPEALLADRALFERYGGWRPEIGSSGDVDWFARIHDAGVELAVLDEVVVHRRVHGASVTHASNRVNEGLLEAARAAIERKRSMAR